MVRWICGVPLTDRKLNLEFILKSVTDVIRQGRLRWYGHFELESTEDWVSIYRTMEDEG